MRITSSILAFTSLTMVVAISAAGCAAKKAPPVETPEAIAPPKPAVQATPPKNLAMTVDLTTPKTPPKPIVTPPPPPPPDPCVALNKQLESSPVHFDLDRSTLSDSAVGEVEAVSAAVKSSGLGATGEFSLEGHCDALGSDGYNVPLSERRAKTVLDRLVALGALSPNRANTIGWGKQRPLDPANTPQAFAKNRRVAISVHCPAK